MKKILIILITLISLIGLNFSCTATKAVDPVTGVIIKTPVSKI
jgi:hypothetical protein